MEKLKKLFVIIAVSTTLIGCARTAPIMTPTETVTAFVSADEMKNMIIEAGRQREWIMTPVSPGIIEGKIISRGHSATVRIRYSSKFYMIDYLGSENLLENNGKIHKNYNRWVNNLSNDIQRRLAEKIVK